MVSAGTCLSLSSPPAQAETYLIPDAGKLYSLDKKEISVADLAPAAQQALYEASRQFYDSIKQIIDNNLLEDYVNELAAKKGKSTSDIEEELFMGKVSENEVREWYEQNKARIGNRPFEGIKNDIDNYLSQQKTEDLRSSVLKQIKAKKKLKLRLNEPVAPRMHINHEGFPGKGSHNPKVTIVEFADYKCPHCREASETLKEIMDRFNENVRLVYLDFPLRTEGVSYQIAAGGVCAAAQGKFWKYHYKAFEKQLSLTEDSPLQLARDLSMDTEKFKACMADQSTREKIMRAREEGERIGVQGTPAIYINGRKHAGYQKDSLEDEIRKLL